MRHAPTHGQAKPPISPGRNQRASERGSRSEVQARHATSTAATADHDPDRPRRPARPGRGGRRRTRPRCPGSRAPSTWSKAERRTPARAPSTTTALAVSALSVSRRSRRIGRTQVIASASAMQRRASRAGTATARRWRRRRVRAPRASTSSEPPEVGSGQHEHQQAGERVEADPLAGGREADEDADQRQHPPRAIAPIGPTRSARRRGTRPR